MEQVNKSIKVEELKEAYYAAMQSVYYSVCSLSEGDKIDVYTASLIQDANNLYEKWVKATLEL